MKHPLMLDPAGRKPGGETPLICTPLIGRSKERLLGELATILRKRPDMLEWRVDYFDAVADTAAVLDAAVALRAAAAGLPMIFTCRSAGEGGQPIALDEAGVVALLEAVCEGGLAECIDFELGNAPAHVRRVREFSRKADVSLILSYHQTSYTPGPEFLIDRFLEAEHLGADVAMVQVRPRDRADVLRLLAATSEADAKTRIPLICSAIGPLGSVSRMVGGLFGSCLTFAVGEHSSAPGQIPVGDLVSVFDVIRRARGGEMF